MSVIIWNVTSCRLVEDTWTISKQPEEGGQLLPKQVMETAPLFRENT
jgi:hypothetical protein